MFDEFKENLAENQTHIWMAIFAGTLLYGHLSIALLAFIIFYAYRDSKNVAFDSPMLHDRDHIIKISPLERGF